MSCFAADCKHSVRREGCQPFYKVPTTDDKLINEWLLACRREEAGKDCRVCSCHFKDGVKTNGPQFFKYNNFGKMKVSQPPSWPSNLLTHLQTWRSTGQLCDVIVVTSDDVSVHFHSVVLAAASPVMCDVIQKERLYGVAGITIHSGFHSTSWQTLAEYLYDSTIELNRGMYTDFLALVQQLGMQSLKQRILAPRNKIPLRPLEKKGVPRKDDALIIKTRAAKSKENLEKKPTKMRQTTVPNMTVANNAMLQIEMNNSSMEITGEQPSVDIVAPANPRIVVMQEKPALDTMCGMSSVIRDHEYQAQHILRAKPMRTKPVIPIMHEQPTTSNTSYTQPTTSNTSFTKLAKPVIPIMHEQPTTSNTIYTHSILKKPFLGIHNAGSQNSADETSVNTSEHQAAVRKTNIDVDYRTFRTAVEQYANEHNLQFEINRVNDAAIGTLGDSVSGLIASQLNQTETETGYSENETETGYSENNCMLPLPAPVGFPGTEDNVPFTLQIVKEEIVSESDEPVMGGIKYAEEGCSQNEDGIVENSDSVLREVDASSVQIVIKTEKCDVEMENLEYTVIHDNQLTAETGYGNSLVEPLHKDNAVEPDDINYLQVNIQEDFNNTREQFENTQNNFENNQDNCKSVGEISKYVEIVSESGIPEIDISSLQNQHIEHQPKNNENLIENEYEIMEIKQENLDKTQENSENIDQTERETVIDEVSTQEMGRSNTDFSSESLNSTANTAHTQMEKVVQDNIYENVVATEKETAREGHTNLHENEDMTEENVDNQNLINHNTNSEPGLIDTSGGTSTETVQENETETENLQIHTVESESESYHVTESPESYVVESESESDDIDLECDDEISDIAENKVSYENDVIIMDGDHMIIVDSSYMDSSHRTGDMSGNRSELKSGYAGGSDTESASGNETENDEWNGRPFSVNNMLDTASIGGTIAAFHLEKVNKKLQNESEKTFDIDQENGQNLERNGIKREDTFGKYEENTKYLNPDAVTMVRSKLSSLLNGSSKRVSSKVACTKSNLNQSVPALQPLSKHASLLHETGLEYPTLTGVGISKSSLCSICGATFKTPKSVKRHMQNCHGGEEWICQHCGDIYKSEYTLKDHIRRRHSDGPNQKPVSKAVSILPAAATITNSVSIPVTYKRIGGKLVVQPVQPHAAAARNSPFIVSGSGATKTQKPKYVLSNVRLGADTDPSPPALSVVEVEEPRIMGSSKRKFAFKSILPKRIQPVAIAVPVEAICKQRNAGHVAMESISNLGNVGPIQPITFAVATDGAFGNQGNSMSSGVVSGRRDGIQVIGELSPPINASKETWEQFLNETNSSTTNLQVVNLSDANMSIEEKLERIRLGKKKDTTSEELNELVTHIREKNKKEKEKWAQLSLPPALEEIDSILDRPSTSTTEKGSIPWSQRLYKQQRGLLEDMQQFNTVVDAPEKFNESWTTQQVESLLETGLEYTKFARVENSKGTLCSICGASFKTPKSVKRHMQNCHGDEEWICQHCGDIYKSEYTLKDHIRRRHSDGPNQKPKRPYRRKSQKQKAETHSYDDNREQFTSSLEQSHENVTYGSHKKRYESPLSHRKRKQVTYDSDPDWTEDMKKSTPSRPKSLRTSKYTKTDISSGIQTTQPVEETTEISEIFHTHDLGDYYLQEN